MTRIKTSSCFLLCFSLLVLAFPALCQAQVQAPAPASNQTPTTIDNKTCLTCHAEATSAPFINAAQFNASAHSGRACTSCHTDITRTPHAAPLKKVNCDTCHPGAGEDLLKSDHGKALKAAAGEATACIACHGDAHAMTGTADKTQAVRTRADITKTCVGCHTEPLRSSKTRALDLYANSAHAVMASQKDGSTSMACSNCHGTHAINGPANPSSRLFWQNIPATCGACHADELKAFTHSVHGKAVTHGKREAPVCTDCHGEHSIEAVKLASSPVSQARIPDTCGQCHAATRITSKFQLPNFVVNTYMESYHGLSVQRGSLTVANCASCHTAHDILPSADPASSINPDNLVKTCGRCHAGMGQQLVNGKIHSGQEPRRENNAANTVRAFYLLLITLVVGMMLVHNFLDLLKKMRAHYLRMAALGKPVRMGLSERLQHIGLLVSFTILAYTGFALKFPHAWWATPFMGTMDWRGMGHRLAAAIFVTVAVYHAWYVLFTVKGRFHLNALKPRRLDFIQFGQTFAYYFGLRAHKPRPGFYGYIEKMEYWALVWGSVIMTVTGVCMMRKEWFLMFFPKWLFDAFTTMHYYEAILACLAILIWHMYFVMFDPDVYPMKTTWLTGQSEPSDDERDASPPPAE